jgi:outer membrane protein TolC
MRGSRGTWRRWGGHLVRGLAAPALLSLGGLGLADEPLPPPQAVNNAPAPGSLDLAACRRIALERQPALAAARASLAAASARAEGLEHLRFAALIQRDLPVRRQQSALGVGISQAALSQAEWDTRHDVAFTYLAAVYAQEQLSVADQGVADLQSVRELLMEIINDPQGRKDVSQRNVDQVDVLMLVAKGRREEAVEGVERALSALREAMGVGCDFQLKVADTRLPRINPTVCKEQVVALAVARRGEMIEAGTAAQVTGLEIAAQRATFSPTSKTFAMGSDLHVMPVPQGSHDDPYKPGAIPIEMPPTINGHRRDRVEQARFYHERAEAVVAKTHNLITLEAEQAYLRWLEASKKLTPFEDAATKASKVNLDIRTKFDPRVPKITVDELMNAGVLATQTRLQANQTRYQMLQALAAVERVTAGGFDARLDAPPAK